MRVLKDKDARAFQWSRSKRMQFNLLVKNNNENAIICYVKKETNKHLHVLKTY